jgi:hypothetical protein
MLYNVLLLVGVKVAVALVAAVTVTTHVLVPEHAPLQPSNVVPMLMLAVRVTTVFSL